MVSTSVLIPRKAEVSVMMFLNNHQLCYPVFHSLENFPDRVIGSGMLESFKCHFKSNHAISYHIPGAGSVSIDIDQNLGESQTRNHPPLLLQPSRRPGSSGRSSGWSCGEPGRG